MHMWQLVPVQKRKCGNCAWQSSVPLTCWRVGSHLLHPRGISRPLYKGFWELLGALSRQEPLELREKLGQGLFGEVFFTRSALAAHVFTMFSQCLDQLKRCVAKKTSWTMRWFLFFHHGHWPRIWPGGGGKGSSLLGASASWADPVRWISARVPPSFRAYLLRICFTFFFWLSKIPRGLLVFCDFSGCFVVSSIYLCCSWPFSWSGHRTWEPREALRKAWFRFVVALRGGHLLAKCHAKPGYRPTCTGASWRILYFCSSGFEDGWDMLRWSWCIMSHVFVQVAPQVASVMIYLREASHVVWDLHSEDTILDIRGSRVHLTLLDVFMPPGECLCCKACQIRCSDFLNWIACWVWRIEGTGLR